MPKIELTNITKRWDKFYAVDNLNLVIDDNAFVTLLGPSGCGKTTTLRMIAGLETPTEGRITIGDKVVFDSELGINIPPNKRKVGFLFQNYALWPNMTVYQNISFGLTNIKEERVVVDEDARKFSAIIDVLKKPSDVVKLVNECKDKNDKLDLQKAYIKLIDKYEISMFAAKMVMSFKLHENLEPNLIASEQIADLEAKVQALKDKHAENGETLNEKFEIVKDGVVQKAVQKLSAEEIDLIVRRVSRIVKIGMFMDRYPSELSGGQQQRVAIARTLAPEPTVLFMDEPLSNLDAKLRLEMRSELQRLHIDTGSTFIYVTHDQMEAMTLASKICLMNNGVLQQYDAPLDVYSKPNNLFVADFVGNPAINFIDAKGTQKTDGTISMTIFDGLVVRFKPNKELSVASWYTETEAAEQAQKKADEERYLKTAEKSNKDVPFKYHVAKVFETEDFDDEIVPENDEFVIGIRPEAIKPSVDGLIRGEIYSAMPTGMETTIKIKIGEYLLTAVVFGGVLYKIEQALKLSFEGDGIMLFSKKTGKLISLGSVTLE